MPSREAAAAAAGPVSRRRERSTAHLYNAMSRVSDQISVVPALTAQLTASEGAQSAPLSPAALSRAPGKQVIRRECLRFPRAALDAPLGRAAVTSPEPSSTASTKDGYASQDLEEVVGSPLPGADQLEELRLQNAVLRRSLAMLQQSVVDSMKGNKAQFMGNGIFRQRKSLDEPIMGFGGGGHAAHDADLEGLRAALVERREALRAALAERDEALRAAELARREAQRVQSRNELLEGELAEREVSLQGLGRRCTVAEVARHAADERLAALEGAAAETSRELAALREAVAEAAARAKHLDGELQASHAESTAALRRYEAALSEGNVLSAERDRLRRHSESADGELDMLRAASLAMQEKASRLQRDRHESAQRRLASALGGRLALRLCFGAWSACRSAAREESWEARVEELRRECSGLAEARVSERAAAEAAAEQLALARAEAQASGEVLRRAEEALAAARADAERWRAQAEEACERSFELKHAASLQGGQAAADRDAALASLREAEARAEELQREVEDARGAAQVLAQELDAKSKAAAAREAGLRKELDAAGKALEEARKASSAAQKLLEEARKKAAELESRLAALAAELEAARAEARRGGAEAGAARRAAQEAEARATALQRRVDELLGQAAGLEAQASQGQGRASEVERLAQENAGLQKDLAALRSSLETAEATAELTSALANELDQLRMQLAQARSEARAAGERAKLLQGEKAAKLKADEEAKALAAAFQATEFSKERIQFQEDARKALEEARQNIRIMVTAPKVAINVGQNDFAINAPFPFEAIKESVRKEVIPRYSRVFAVAESAGDAEIRREVQAMVEQLAASLQTKIFELMPQAEGTCNWDGFGSKCGTLGTARR